MSSIREIALAKAVGGGGGGGGDITVKSLTATENKMYTAPSGKAYSPVNVSVPNSYGAGDEGKVVSNGELVAQTSDTVTENGTVDTTLINSLTVNVGGGSGIVLSGTSAPTADIGSNQDLYVQYSVYPVGDYLYGINAIYRKISGAWIAYVDPTDPTLAVHVWTKATSGYDAAMYVQRASYDPIAGTYTPVGDADIVVYSSVQAGNTYNLFNLAKLSYGPPWKIVASQTITDDVSTYNTGATVTTWNYNTVKDIYLRMAI